MSEKLKGFIREREEKAHEGVQAMEARKAALRDHHRAQRREQNAAQEKRRVEENTLRAGRFRKGMRGLWDRFTGKHAKIKARNSLEIFWAAQRNAREKETLIEAQLTERRALQKQILSMRQNHTARITRLHRDIAVYLRMSVEEQDIALTPRRKAQQQHPHYSINPAPTLKM